VAAPGMKGTGAASWYCGRCGARAEPDAVFCGRCGGDLGPAPRRRSRGRAPAVIIAALIAAGAVAVYLELRPASHATASAPSASGGVPATAMPTPIPTPVRIPPPTPSDDSLALTTMNGHWDAIREHRFSDAYEYLGPDLVAIHPRSDWITSHERDGIGDVQYRFRVRGVSGDSATVDIVALRTVAASAVKPGNPTGCVSWTGDYVLIRQGGRWLIDQANLSPGSC
jgi:ribosomal protein L40E